MLLVQTAVCGTCLCSIPVAVTFSMIKSKAIKLLYFPEGLRKSDTQLLKNIRELNDELGNWCTSIDIKYRPKLCFEGCIPITGINAAQKMSYIINKFEYHYFMTTIHQATSRCNAWANGASGEMEGVSFSLALAVKSNRFTLVYLRAAVKILVGESF
jgi:hypothetical protein